MKLMGTATRPHVVLVFVVVVVDIGRVAAEANFYIYGSNYGRVAAEAIFCVFIMDCVISAQKLFFLINNKMRTCNLTTLHNM